MPMPTTAMNMWRPALIKLSKTTSISSISRDGTYVTYITSSSHNFVAGEPIVITGASSAGFNITGTIYDVPNSTTFRIASAATGTTSTATGTVIYYLSDHNRGPMQESNEKIENSKRMANGLMRKYVVASKKSFSISWTMLPGLSTQTVDGYLGAMALRNFYDSNYGKSIVVSLYAGTASVATQAKGTSPSATATYTVFISNFSATINKRLGDIDYWDVSIDFEEA